jgi:hypothetical protein
MKWDWDTEMESKHHLNIPRHPHTPILAVVLAPYLRLSSIFNLVVSRKCLDTIVTDSYSRDNCGCELGWKLRKNSPSIASSQFVIKHWDDCYLSLDNCTPSIVCISQSTGSSCTKEPMNLRIRWLYNFYARASVLKSPLKISTSPKAPNEKYCL